MKKIKSIEAERLISEVQRIIDDKKAFSFASVAKESGYKSQDFTDIKSGKKDMQRKLLDAVSEKFPIDKEFILTGNRSKRPFSLSDQFNAISITELQEIDDSSPFLDLGNGQYIMIVPHVQEYAYAGYLGGYGDSEFVEDLPKHSFVVNKQHRGKYIAFTVIGDSMDDKTSDAIVEGSVVTGRDIKKDLWKSRFHINRFKDYIIVHKEGILVKRIIEHNVEKGIIVCHSLNPDKDNYPDFELNLDDCLQILNIVNVTQIR